MIDENMVERVDLKPCPFCGTAVQLRQALWPSNGDEDTIIHVVWTNCGVGDFSVHMADECRSVVAAWNTRADTIPIVDMKDLG